MGVMFWAGYLLGNKEHHELLDEYEETIERMVKERQ
jgi:hypothetical protein